MIVENSRRLELPTEALAQAIGPHLEQLVLGLRYDHYRDKERDPYWEFVEKMGPDVVWLTHPDVMAQRMKKFIDHRRYEEDISLEEEQLLLVACYVHDLGELIIDGEGVGDVAGFLKGDSEVGVEKEIFSKVMEGVDDGEGKDLLLRAYEEVELKRESRLGKMLGVVEKMGYVENAIQAIKGDVDDRPVFWMFICGSVTSSSLVELLHLRDEYGYVWEFLNDNWESFDKIFEELEGVELVKLGDDGRVFCDYRDKFVRATQAYMGYIDEQMSMEWQAGWDSLKRFEEERFTHI